MKTLFHFMIVCCFFGLCHAQTDVVELLKIDTAPVVDGQIDTVEWEGAKELSIHTKNGNAVSVWVTYDSEHLYVAFTDLTDLQNSNLNAEVLVSTGNEEASWTSECYWFHSSYGNCFATGQYYYWDDCSTEPVGWKANTFPFLNGNNTIEFKISFTKLNISPKQGEQLKIAFKISDPLEQHAYWPEAATIAKPDTWGTLRFN